MGVENRVREIRKGSGITQKKMAEDLKITRQTITAIERNKYNPSLELALKITSYFGLPVEAVFNLREEGEESQEDVLDLMENVPP